MSFYNIALASLGTVGLMEFLKNFLKAKRLHAIVMLPIAIGCYYSVVYLPEWVTGAILTIGTVQLGYQGLVQGFTKIVNNIGGANAV